MILTLFDIIWVYPTIGTIVWLVSCLHAEEYQHIFEWLILIVLWPLAALGGLIQMLDRMW